MKTSLLKIAAAIIVATAMAGCPSSPPQGQAATPSATKIKFRLDNIRPDGLRGPPGGLVSITYEFCVPANEQTYEKVRRIDPSVKFSPGKSGRIGCTKDQTLCLGSTHQSRWREVLQELSSQTYIAEIRECFFE